MGRNKDNTTGNGRLKEGTSLNKGQLFNFADNSYLERTSRPVYAVAFLLPFIAFYELGTFRINTNILNQSQIRVVAFVWMQNALESLGFGGKFAWAAPPLAVIVILLSLQIASRKQWQIWLGDFVPMLIECILLAVPLIVLALLLNSSEIHRAPGQNTAAFDSKINSLPYCATSYNNDMDSSEQYQNGIDNSHSLLANIVTGIGAGIYEELIFRLFLICVLMMLFQDVFKLGHDSSIILSVLISAALFSAHHHIDILGGHLNIVDPFDITKFAFRTIAGIYFAFLFAIRGFGITAGTHAFYNIIAVSLTAFLYHK